MATYDVVYWQEIPVEVRARGDGITHQELLSGRFQRLVCDAALQRRQAAAEDYIRHWVRSEPRDRPGSALEVARDVAREIELQYDAIREGALRRGAAAPAVHKRRP